MANTSPPEYFKTLINITIQALIISLRGGDERGGQGRKRRGRLMGQDEEVKVSGNWNMKGSGNGSVKGNGSRVDVIIMKMQYLLEHILSS